MRLAFTCYCNIFCSSVCLSVCMCIYELSGTEASWNWDKEETKRAVFYFVPKFWPVGEFSYERIFFQRLKQSVLEIRHLCEFGNKIAIFIAIYSLSENCNFLPYPYHFHNLRHRWTSCYCCCRCCSCSFFPARCFWYYYN